jgi:hypothetical protein
LFWIVSGTVFVFNDIDNVHGDFEFEKPDAVALNEKFLGPKASAAIRALEAGLNRDVSPTLIAMTRRLGRDVYAVYEKGEGTPVGYVDAQTGKLAAPLTGEEASVVALAHYKGKADIRSVERLDEAPLEYRGRPLPVFRVNFDDRKDTSFYVSPHSGKVVVRRNWAWRVFDFFWMLHTMDYWERDDFNHPLIRAAGVFAVMAVMSGAVLLFQRFIPR